MKIISLKNNLLGGNNNLQEYIQRVVGNGNCLYFSIAISLQLKGILISPEDVRMIQNNFLRQEKDNMVWKALMEGEIIGERGAIPITEDQGWGNNITMQLLDKAFHNFGYSLCFTLIDRNKKNLSPYSIMCDTVRWKEREINISLVYNGFHYEVLNYYKDIFKINYDEVPANQYTNRRIYAGDLFMPIKKDNETIDSNQLDELTTELINLADKERKLMEFSNVVLGFQSINIVYKSNFMSLLIENIKEFLKKGDVLLKLEKITDEYYNDYINNMNILFELIYGYINHLKN